MNTTRSNIFQIAGPIGWFLKLLMLVGRIMYTVVKIVLWILRRFRPS